MRCLKDWLIKIGQELPQHGSRGLESVQAVAQRLGLLQQSSFHIHVGGTNGKGTAVASLATIYRHSGYRVGTFISPHLFTANERIACDGVLIPDPALVEAFCAIEAACQGVRLSYFEYFALAAVWWFEQQKVDLVLLEVGIGGRLDAVNAWEPGAILITSIGLDHQTVLGNSLEAIAREKAAIMRQGVPAVIAFHARDPILLAEAARIGAKATILQAGETKDAALALARVLEPMFALCLEGLEAVLEKVALPGRFEVHRFGSIDIFDVAHNVQAVTWLMERCQQHFPKSKVHVVWSSLEEKDLAKIVAVVKPFVHSWHIAALEVPRASSLVTLQAVIKGVSQAALKVYASIEKAYEGARLYAKAQEIVLVFGSFYTVSACLQARQGIWNKSLKSDCLGQPL